MKSAQIRKLSYNEGRFASGSRRKVWKSRRRDGRVAEGGGLLNRYRVKSSIGGSNPPLSARNSEGLTHYPLS